MSKNKLILISGLLVFISLTVYALWRELARNEQQIKMGISGVVRLSPGVGGLSRADNVHVLLFDSETLQPVAINSITPFVPPLTFYIGQEHAIGNIQLKGSYRLLILSDKDGQLKKSADGEVIGDLTPPIALSTKEVNYTLAYPFLELPSELLKSTKKTIDPSTMIQGKITVAPDLLSHVKESDRLIIMLFDATIGRPVAIKILSQFVNNQSFSIGQEDAMPGQRLKGEYSLRIITDKNNQPFESSPGELIGRSKEQISLGTNGLLFQLNQEYKK
ncbi:MAG: hypothetical protein HQM14_01390 [SAR324 cluster bacterium]|nr:hypothetical protein [SAR324 cluster bacterium]